MNIMLLAKTIKCKFIEPTQTKIDLLEKEWKKYHDFIQLEQAGLDWIADNIIINAGYKTQARWMWKKFAYGKNQPMSISNAKFRIKQTQHRHSEYWARLPIGSGRKGIWMPIKPHKPFPENYKLGESKLFKQKGKWHLHICVKKEVEVRQSFSNVIAIDLGERVTATVLHDDKPIFYGREIRGIRRHYSWLRKRLGEKKKLNKIRQVGHTEQNKTNQILHDISNSIVSLASSIPDSAIVVGDLKGMNKSAKNKGRRMKRIVGNMPYFKLTNYITYKANWQGIPIVKVSEKYTSQTCSKCGYGDKANRKSQGLFKCKSCGYEVNADFNAVKNIHKRSLDYMFKDGVLLEPISVENASIEMCKA